MSDVHDRRQTLAVSAGSATSPRHTAISSLGERVSMVIKDENDIRRWLELLAAAFAEGITQPEDILVLARSALS